MKSGLNPSKNGHNPHASRGPFGTVKAPPEYRKLPEKLPATLIVLMLAGACGGGAETISVSADEKAKAIAELEPLQKVGVLQYDCQNLETQIAPAAWQQLNANAKRAMAIQAASACFTDDRGFRMTIVDSQSGKRLASIGALGYSVE